MLMLDCTQFLHFMQMRSSGEVCTLTYRRLYICTAVLQALYAAAYARPCTHLCTTQSEHFGEAITGKRVMLEADSWTFDSLSSANFFCGSLAG